MMGRFLFSLPQKEEKRRGDTTISRLFSLLRLIGAAPLTLSHRPTGAQNPITILSQCGLPR
jgi:hypothetical protein